MKSKMLKWMVPVLCLALAFGGCSKTEKKLKLAFVTNNAATFWTIARAGCSEAEKELGNVTVDFRIPSTGGAAGQRGRGEAY